MKLTEFLEDIGRPVSYYPSLRPITGSVNASIMLCQFIYWRGKERDPDGWLYKSQKEIESETGLSRDEQENARRKLRKAKIIEEMKKDVPCRLYYKIDLNRVNDLWDQHKRNELKKNQESSQIGQKPQTSMGQSAKLACDKTTPKSGGMPHATTIDYTESSHETTTTLQPVVCSSSCDQVKSLPHPRLFEGTWKGCEQQLVQVAAEYPDKDVYMLADQIDHQHANQPAKSGQRRSAMGLLMSHLRGKIIYLRQYAGYTKDWREMRDAKLTSLNNKLSECEDGIDPKYSLTNALEAWSALPEENKIKFKSTIPSDHVYFGLINHDITMASLWFSQVESEAD